MSIGYDAYPKGREYPRTLLEARPDLDGDGQSDAAVTCTDPTDCTSKCRRLDRTAREDGSGVPAACALCDLPCPSNVLSSITDAITALADDVFGAVRLVVLCFAQGGFDKCACAIGRRSVRHHACLVGGGRPVRRAGGRGERRSVRGRARAGLG